MRWPLLTSLAASLALALTFAAQSLPAAAPATPAATPPADQKGKWVDISTKLVASLEADGKKIGYPGGAAGIGVDPATGIVAMIIPDQGIQMSADHGTTWTRVDGNAITGRGETGGTLQFDPNGKRLACFMLDGTAGMTLDGGKTWSKFATVGRNWDFASVLWSDEKPTHIFAMMHEAGGELRFSGDAGKTWKKVAKDKDYDGGGVGIFDANTLIATKKNGGIFRSTDAGTTWTKVSDIVTTSHVPVVIKDTAIMISKEGLITSKDKGATWTKHGAAIDATWGPIVKDDKHMVCSGKKGIYETKDAGETWTLILTFPKPEPGAKGGGWSYTGNGEWYNHVAWDSKNDIFYVSHMGLPAYRYQR